MERLDRAYASPNWMLDFPHTLTTHLPISTSDHAPIFVRMDPPASTTFRPYQVESWCLSHPEVRHIVISALAMVVSGSPMYTLSRKLAVIKSKLRPWCLDRRLFWGINWHKISSHFSRLGEGVENLVQGVHLVGQRRDLVNQVVLAFSYWKQRTKDTRIQFREAATSFFFRRLRGP